jgi:hypothetical protein
VLWWPLLCGGLLARSCAAAIDAEALHLACNRNAAISSTCSARPANSLGGSLQAAGWHHTACVYAAA